jgi:hypothetical protein
MDWENYYPARGKSGIVGLDVTSTASGMSAMADSKWIMQFAVFGFCNCATSATMGFFETTATGSFSETGVFFQTFLSATCGSIYLDFGKVGYQASQTNSRMGVFVGSCTLSWTFLSSGYYGRA